MNRVKQTKIASLIKFALPSMVNLSPFSEFHIFHGVATCHTVDPDQNSQKLSRNTFWTLVTELLCLLMLKHVDMSSHMSKAFTCVLLACKFVLPVCKSVLSPLWSFKSCLSKFQSSNTSSEKLTPIFFSLSWTK